MYAEQASFDRPTEACFRLHPAIDGEMLARQYRSKGRVRIDPFLAEEDARRLHGLLADRNDWRHILNNGDKVYDLDRETVAGFTLERRADFETALANSARRGFQFFYEGIRVPDEESARRGSDDPLAAFASWMSEGPVRDLLRHVTGETGIDFADAQATAYGPGAFLTGHDDAVAGKNRHAAYVYSLSPEWRIEWGGLLLFHEPDGGVSGLTPKFNALTLFRVPQPHSVSMVTRAAPASRFSITGWLRSR